MRRIGMLTPSSNTVLEPQCQLLLTGVSSVSVHFARFRVTQIALADAALRQFDPEPMLHAAELLADAKLDCITWNGTSAGWLGLASDHALVAAIEARTGIRATTCLLTLAELLRSKTETLGLVTPYTDDVQAKILATFAAEDMPVAAERHLGIRDNHTFGLVDPATLTRMVREVTAEGCRRVVVFCTNLAGASLVPAWEAELGIEVLDSVAISLYGALQATGGLPEGIGDGSRLFGARRGNGR